MMLKTGGVEMEATGSQVQEEGMGGADSKQQQPPPRQPINRVRLVRSATNSLARLVTHAHPLPRFS